MLKIEKANIDHAPIIALLGRITFAETFGDLFPDKQVLLDYFERTFSVDKIREGLEKTANIFWIAYWNELPVGYAKLKLNSKSTFVASEKVCQLQKIYVLQDFLSKKIGSALQSEVLKEAKQQAFHAIWLSVVTSNDRALYFYLKSGYSEVGMHDFQIGPYTFNFRVMSKKIT